MKLTHITLSSSLTNALTFSFRDTTYASPFFVKDITGLDPEQIISKFNNASKPAYAYENPIKYYSLVLDPKDIVFNIGLNPNYSSGESIESLREKLYKLFSSTRTGLININFYNGLDFVATLEGSLSKLESLLFIKTSEIKITINCPDPILKSPLPIYLDVSTFGFGRSTPIIDNISTAPHGLDFGLRVTGNASLISIYDENVPSWIFTVAFSFLNNDLFRFSSVRGKRYLFVDRGINTIQLVDKIIYGSVWPSIFPGQNSFRFVGGNFTWNYLRHNYNYWGI